MRLLLLAMMSFAGFIAADVQNALAQVSCHWPGPAESLNQKVQRSEHCFLAQRRLTRKEDKGAYFISEYEVMEIIKSSKDQLNPRMRFDIHELPKRGPNAEEDAAPTLGASVLFVADGPDLFRDTSVLCEANEQRLAYLRSTSSVIHQSDLGAIERRRLFLPYLGSNDPLIDEDVLLELSSDGYQGIAQMKQELPRTKILAAFKSPKTSTLFRGSYGILLGLCGHQEDASLLESKFTLLESGDFRFGVEGYIIGYLLIVGEDGLGVVEDTKIKVSMAKTVDGKETALPFHETYAALVALRFFHNEEPMQIPKERIEESMRLLLSRPELADLVILDLTKWQNWTAQDQIISMVDDDRFKIPVIQRAIVRFLYQSSMVAGENEPDGHRVRLAHAVRAEEELKKIEMKWPKIYSEALMALRKEK